MNINKLKKRDKFAHCIVSYYQQTTADLGMNVCTVVNRATRIQ